MPILWPYRVLPSYRVMIDIGVVFVENIIGTWRWKRTRVFEGKAFANLIYRSVSEVSGQCSPRSSPLSSVFLPVFFWRHGGSSSHHWPIPRLRLISACLLGIAVLPTLVYYIFSIRITSKQVRRLPNILLAAAGITLVIFTGFGLYLALTFFGLNNLFAHRWKNQRIPTFLNIDCPAGGSLPAHDGMAPSGRTSRRIRNLLFVVLIMALCPPLLWML